jgi:hypothetical protein
MYSHANDQPRIKTMSAETGYQCWTNYETSNAALWINNDEGLQEMVIRWANECMQYAIDIDKSDVKDSAASALADMIKSFLYEDVPEVSGFYADILTAAMQAVDYREIADSFIDDIDIYCAGWNMPGYGPDEAPAFFLECEDARNYIVNSMVSHRDQAEDGQEDAVAKLNEAIELIDSGRGELGITVGGWHYFVTKV